MVAPLTIVPLCGIGEVVAGDDLAAMICDRLAAFEFVLMDGDVLVVAQKIVSKAEGRTVDLRGIVPSGEAREIAGITGKPPELVEVVLRESAAVMRAKENVLIVRHKLGLVMANAGIDRSNVPAADGADPVLLLPVDPDRSAEELRRGIGERTGCEVGVIVSDSFGRAWRNGVVGVAIGAAGIAALIDRRGDVDREGRALMVTEVAQADAVAAAAGLVMGEAAESRPVVIVRGLARARPEKDAKHLIRSIATDLFP